MTLTIRLTPTEAAHLRSAARARGVAPDELARQLIAELPPPEAGLASPEVGGAAPGPDKALRERVRGVRGKYAALGVTTADLHRDRQQEKTREGEPNGNRPR